MSVMVQVLKIIINKFYCQIKCDIIVIVAICDSMTFLFARHRFRLRLIINCDQSPYFQCRWFNRWPNICVLDEEHISFSVDIKIWIETNAQLIETGTQFKRKTFSIEKKTFK